MGTDEYVEVAHNLPRTWSRRLKMKRFKSLKTKYPEPDEATAWTYVKAYFEESYDAVFGTVHRPSFESRLRAHFARADDSPQTHDAPWFALRNTVYASGCRALLSKNTSVSFIAANTKSHQYFMNAMSVFGEMLFGRSGFTALQAIVLMGFYAEVLGSPAIEYPLASNAVQLALARGLHRSPARSWNLPEADVLTRNWLWWTIYCLEKQIVFRSGRPSLIDDENISTPIPTKAPPGSTIDVETLTLIVKHAQISSQISRRIMSVKAPRQPVTKAIQTIQDIHQQLETLFESIPSCLKEKDNYPSTARRNQSIYLHFAIWGSFMATHIMFFYPWFSARYHHHDVQHGGGDVDPDHPASEKLDSMIQDQIKRSAEVVANAARKIILTARATTTDANTPMWLAFYYPIYAHANLLVYVLMDPSRETAAGDLALLDVCAGHFAFIELITDSEISFHFPRDSVALCSKTVRAAAARKTNIDGVEVVDSTTQDNNVTCPTTPQATNRVGGMGVTGDGLIQFGDVDTGGGDFDPPRSIPSTDMFDVMDFDIGAFDIFSSIDICDDLVDPALTGLFD
ncbi:uncharacterized protein PV06_05553 [Exophiala oligosperma]|uniref:Xylanolytic transcriptional activator regulatory domain-containing protein n=1 Tax=Exophiala oligosperma TaxID=215243 RepID=A0A0D2E2E8_9EURO|nr:uncharacterized protein PV06_05553 [Exophiala oligosperma]KIW41959.1 hypothetical protein PV06_05553 [Exophiala oligosperma]